MGMAHPSGGWTAELVRALARRRQALRAAGGGYGAARARPARVLRLRLLVAVDRIRSTPAVNGTGVMLVFLALACSTGTEPSTNPRDQRTGPGETGRVSGRVLTAGITRVDGTWLQGEEGDTTAGDRIEVGPLAGETVPASHPLAGVVVELGIVHFDRASDSVAEGTARSVLVPMAVPDVWAGPTPRFLDPGPAAPPGRFEVIARATTNRRGEFQFSGAPRGRMLMLRVLPPAPHLETYSRTPLWLGDQSAKLVDLVVRGGDDPAGRPMPRTAR